MPRKRPQLETHVIMYEGQSYEVEHDMNEGEFNANDYLEEIRSGNAPQLDTDAAQAEQGEGELDTTLLTNDNPNTVRSAAWYKHEISDFDGATVPAKATIKVLHETLAKLQEDHKANLNNTED